MVSIEDSNTSTAIRKLAENTWFSCTHLQWFQSSESGVRELGNESPFRYEKSHPDGPIKNAVMAITVRSLCAYYSVRTLFAGSGFRIICERCFVREGNTSNPVSLDTLKNRLDKGYACPRCKYGGRETPSGMPLSPEAYEWWCKYSLCDAHRNRPSNELINWSYELCSKEYVECATGDCPVCRLRDSGKNDRGIALHVILQGEISDAIWVSYDWYNIRITDYSTKERCTQFTVVKADGTVTTMYGTGISLPLLSNDVNSLIYDM